MYTKYLWGHRRETVCLSGVKKKGFLYREGNVWALTWKVSRDLLDGQSMAF